MRPGKLKAGQNWANLKFYAQNNWTCSIVYYIQLKYNARIKNDMRKFQIIRYRIMFNNYYKNQSIWNRLSTKKLVLSSYHEKGLGSWVRISSALVLFVY